VTGIRVAHANIQVSDIRASLAFYRHLGLELVGCLRIDPIVLYYVSAPDDPTVTFELADNPSLEERSPGTGHIALAVGDLDAMLTRLTDVAILPEAEPYHPGDREDLRICFVRDPDGTRLELIEGTFPTPQDAPPSNVIGQPR
jgi:lactoylglutathione lyase